MSDELTLFKLNDDQLRALAEALDASERRATGDHRMLAALRRRKLIDINHGVTELGRYQVRWYAEDAGRAWGIQGESFGSYVARGAAPQPDGFEPRSTSARAWWKPGSVVEYERGPGRGNHGHRVDIDMSTVIRQFRAGVSIRKIAAALGVSAVTVTSRLEEAGEKPTTSSSRTAYRRDQRPSISAESAG